MTPFASEAPGPAGLGCPPVLAAVAPLPALALPVALARDLGLAQMLVHSSPPDRRITQSSPSALSPSFLDPRMYIGPVLHLGLSGKAMYHFPL